MLHNGEIEIVRLPALDVSQHRAAEQIEERLLYRWSPPSDLVPKLPDGYSVALDSWRFRDGVQRFTPADPQWRDFGTYHFYDATAFALKASVGGRALLWKRGGKSPCPWLGYEEGRLFLQYAQHLREHFGRTRKLGNSLHLCTAARPTRGEKDILPDDIGLDASGTGVRWTIGRLKDEGQKAAQERRLESPTEDDFVRLGLLAAARINPLSMSNAESEFITRSVLFRLDTDLPKPSDELLEFVASCVRKSLKKKLHVSDDEFRKWIDDPHSSLIRSIQRTSGDRLTRNQIKSALLELAWQAVKMFGYCLDVQMREFLDAMPPQLTSTEEFLYQQTYLANPIFGGLPLILLHDRMLFLKEAIADYWNQPSDVRQIHVIRTMIYYYGVLAGNRRNADALYKRRTHLRGANLSSIRAEHDVASVAPRPRPMVDALHDAVRTFAAGRGIIPRQFADEWVVRIAHFDDATVEIDMFDPTRHRTKTLTIARSEFDSLIKESPQMHAGCT